MRLYLPATIVVLLSSCLKQSIPDAMLNPKHENKITATLSYELNGNPVNITVGDATNQDPVNYILGCSKSTGYYILSGLSDSGETLFFFLTDSLTTGEYIYPGSYGDKFFISYNNQNEYAHAISDTLRFTITAYHNGCISGNFSGQLTPALQFSGGDIVFGNWSSILITNGSFKNVPVFY